MEVDATLYKLLKELSNIYDEEYYLTCYPKISYFLFV